MSITQAEINVCVSRIENLINENRYHFGTKRAELAESIKQEFDIIKPHISSPDCACEAAGDL